MEIHFCKMHSLRNDFMLVNAVDEPVQPTDAAVRRWADRRSGIGFDQLLLLEACNGEADFSMRVFNSDGSEAKQCGNGVRCAARFAERERMFQGRTLRVAVDERVVMLELLDDGMVRADMGVAEFNACGPALSAAEKPESCTLQVAGRSLHVGIVLLGNLHAVVETEDAGTCPVAEIGLSLQECEHFPDGVNAEFMQVENAGNVRLRVYERGVGETPACGSGACAAVAVGRRRGLLDDRVCVSLPGGVLDVEQAPDERLKLTGPAVFSYDGVVLCDE